MSGGSTKQQSTTQPVTNPAFPALMANAQQAQSIANQPFQAYTGTLVAPANQNLTNSWDMYNNIANSNVGAAPLNSAINTASGVANYQPQQVTAGTLPQTDLSGYMNPYQNDVINTTMADLERQRQTAGVADAQKATAAGAFGGSRSGVAQSLTNDAYDRNTASTLANLNSQNFTQAQGAATSDLNRQLSASQGNQQAGLSGAQLNLTASSDLSALSDQQLQEALQQAQGVNQSGTQQQGIDQQTADALYQEFLRRVNYPIQGQTLVNQSLGLLPGGVSNQTNSSGSSSTWNSGLAGAAGPIATALF